MITPFFSRLFTSIFGRFSWEAPRWLQKANPKRLLGMVASLVLLLVAAFYLYHWYAARPQPEQVITKIATPRVSAIEDNHLVPDALVIDFGITSNHSWQSRSVAPMQQIGKDITEGVTIKPAIAGTWRWDSDSRLVFMPSVDWPAGQTYDITFAADFFAKNANMASWQASFSTLPFAVTVKELKFYQDPINPALRQVVATLAFNFPVDTNRLENHIHLNWQALKNAPEGAPFKLTFTYDELKRVAYLKSDVITLPDRERYAVLTLDKGIHAAQGDAKTNEAVQDTLLLPDAASYFKISKVATSIIRNLQDQPEQILTVETTLGVQQSALDSGIHAYLLPKDYPATAYEKAKPDYAWQSPGEITDNILALSQPLSLQAKPAEHAFATLHSYQYKVKTPAYIYVKIDAGVKAFGDFSLAHPYAMVMPAPTWPQEITYLHKGALLALGTEEKLSVLVRGLSAVKFKVARVLPQDMNHLITQTAGDFSNPYFLNSTFNQDNISEIFGKIVDFDASDASKAQYTALDLQNYLQNTGQLGLFLLQANGWDKEKSEALGVQANRLILITDLGLLVKDNVNGTHDFFVQSITQGTPVNQASVSLLGKNGVALFTRVTDAQGHVNFPSLKDFSNEREPTVYLVSKGHDVSFIPYNRYDRQLNYSRFDIGGVTYHEENAAALTAYIFTERGIYRPGDIIHAGMIVKQPWLRPQPAGLPLEAMVVDPRGVTVKDSKITLNDTGLLTLDYQTEATSTTGQYQIYLYIVKDNHPGSLLGSATVNVAEFLPDRIRINAQLSAQSPGWISPSGLSANIRLSNLYGTPAVNHKVTGKLLLSPQSVQFKAYPQYIFVDPLLNPKKPPRVFTEDLTATKTNEKGEATVNLKLDRFEKATYQLTVFAEGFEAEGGRSVTTQTKALVSPLAYFVGYHPDGDLQYIKQQAAHAVHLIAINPALKQQALSDLILQVNSQKPVSTLVKKEDGTYQYESLMQTTPVSTTAFSIPEQGINYTLPTDTIGDFLIVISDKQGNTLTRFTYHVVGASQLPLPKNAELNVKLNKTEYHPGDDIEMQITAPYTGAGLITLERDKVYAAQWFKSDTTSSLQKIHIPADFLGNGYVNIAFVRDLNSPEIFMSPLSFNVLPFSVTHAAQMMHITLSTPDHAQPGDKLTINYQTDKSGKMIVFAVDEGILQVTQYQTPNPLDYFFAKHALEVNTQQIVDQILPKFMAERELSSIGGDGGAEVLLKNLNPFKRKTEAPVVFWSGILDADNTSRSVNFTIPDYFNGSLRIMAIAVAADAAGFAARSTEVRGPFVISPNIPTFVAPDDTFEVTASIANNVKGSGDHANVTVTCHTSAGLTLIDAATQTLVVPEGEERSVRFKIKATSTLGSATLTFSATLGDKTSQLASTVSIRPVSPYAVTVNSGYSNDTNISMPVSRVLYPAFREVEAVASYSPFILLTGIQRYMNDYPYGCIEQLVSKGMPWLAILQQNGPNPDLQTKIQQTIQLIAQRQMASGGFSYWPGVNTSNNQSASVYAMHFLTEAKAQGFVVSPDVFSSGMGFLRDVANQDTTTLEQARLQAYAIYLLTRNEIITTNYLTHLQATLDQHPDYHWHNDMLSVYIAATWQLLKNTDQANKIIVWYQPDKFLSATSDFNNQAVDNAQYLYLIAKHFPQRLPKMDKVLNAVVSALNHTSLTTLLSGYTSLALSAWPAVSANESPQVSIKTDANAEVKLAEGKAQLNAHAKQVNFLNPAHRLLFYQLTQAGFDQTLPQQAVNQGIEVYREFRDANNKVIKTANLGDEVSVHLFVRALDNQYHYNVSVVDLLPGGFDVVRESVQPGTMDYAEAREDRVIFFGTLGPTAAEIIYKIKASNTGDFSVPPVYAAAMYNPAIQSIGADVGKMEVK